MVYFGSVKSVVTDGSVTYTVNFPIGITSVSQLDVQIVGGTTWGGYFININVFNQSTTGFQFTVTGGLSSTIPDPVTVYWRVS